MSSTMQTTTIRIDRQEKAEAASILESIGLSFNAYLNLAVKQLINQRRVPFDLEPAPVQPNEETRRAMVEAEAKELGILPDDSPTFADMASLMSYLDGE